MMYEGKALGGPRDGVKLTAELSWDGMVEQPRKANTGITYYPGHYQWNSRTGRWVWAERLPTPSRTCKGQFHRWQGRARYGTKCLCGKKVAINLE